jgi:tryptophan halogenase
MNVRPKKYHPLMDGFDRQDLVKMLQENVQDIYSTVMQMPKHGDYIRQHCAAKKVL